MSQIMVMPVPETQGDAEVPTRDRRAALEALLRSPRLGGAVQIASAQAQTKGVSEIGLLPVSEQLRPLLPGGGLPRGSTVSLTASAGLLWELLATPSANGAWVAVVGQPALARAILAAVDAGLDASRLLLVPEPGDRWPEAVAALLDGADVVVAAPSGVITGGLARQLTARARQRGAVLVSFGTAWPGADVVLEPTASVWRGPRAGRGRLRDRELEVTCRGRGNSSQPRKATLRLHAGLSSGSAQPAVLMATR
ncbi:MAG: hypothetical protein H0T78_12160 [Longispora sp.]|nr:hypothetical protein [Longispora sp. (in: high G+C Gram-positive bacteria)]